mmetsp:Transcript_87021/g.246744  ORF Transcript_87021/g.246744 Transcript_87021/m.246744 type:complete len:214 (-) Transcript_87021:306-947(-)
MREQTRRCWRDRPLHPAFAGHQTPCQPVLCAGAAATAACDHDQNVPAWEQLDFTTGGAGAGEGRRQCAACCWLCNAPVPSAPVVGRAVRGGAVATATSDRPTGGFGPSTRPLVRAGSRRRQSGRGCPGVPDGHAPERRGRREPAIDARQRAGVAARAHARGGRACRGRTAAGTCDAPRSPGSLRSLGGPGGAGGSLQHACRPRAAPCEPGPRV